MIINIRGGNGSGKSYLVGMLRDYCKETPEIVNRAEGGRSQKILYHVLTTPWGDTVGLVGGYESACGGCDGIHPYDDIWLRIMAVREVATHVIYEGMAVSSSYGSIGRASEPYGDEFVFMFLDTPLATCLRNIMTRRNARGKTDNEAFDPYNVIKKWRDVQRTYPKMVATGRRVVVISHHNPLQSLLLLLAYGYEEAELPNLKFPTDVPPMPRKRDKTQ